MCPLGHKSPGASGKLNNTDGFAVVTFSIFYIRPILTYCGILVLGWVHLRIKQYSSNWISPHNVDKWLQRVPAKEPRKEITLI